MTARTTLRASPLSDTSYCLPVGYGIGVTSTDVKSRDNAFTDPPRSVRVAVAQLDAIPVDRHEQALEQALVAIADSAQRGAQLVVLPECSWPGYVLGREWASTWDARDQDRALEHLSRVAERHSVVAIVGMALAHERSVWNVAVTIDRDGTVRGMSEKEFLWDFDRHWFAAGANAGVVETSIGRLGVFVCADGRVPEIVRRLTLEGAELLIDCTALPTSDPDPDSWSNPQQDFILSARAAENGLWLAVANKVGIERQVVTYTGRSAVINAAGRVIVAASPSRPEIVITDVPLASARLPVRRRPELYHPVIAPVSPAGMTSRRRARIAVSGLDRHATDVETELLEAMAIDLVIWPAASASPRGEWITASGPDIVSLTRDGDPVATWRRTHGGEPTGESLGPVIETRAGPLAAMIGPDGWVPEVARGLTLQGAHTIVWFDSSDPDQRIAATRAAENRVWLVTVSRENARVIDPDGRIRADAGASERIVTAQIDTAFSSNKEIAPGSNVILHRRPDLYRRIVEQTPRG